MLLKFLFPLVWLVAAGLAAAQSNPEKKPLPPLNRERARLIDVKHIALDLRFDWPRKQAFGSAAVTFAPLFPADRIALDAALMQIDSISLKGKALKFDYDGGDRDDNLRISLDRVYRAGETLSITIEYRTNRVNELDPNTLGFGGNTGKGLRFSGPTSNDPNKPREIWSAGEPGSNRYWFPSFDSPNDPRTTELTATVDGKLTVISNGRLIETKDNGDGTRRFHYKTDAPYPNHLTSLVVGEQVNVRLNYGGVVLNNFGYSKEREWVAATVERLPEMMRFFSEKTGVEYPFAGYSQVFVQDIGTFSANQTVSAITENMVDDAGTHADFFYLWDLTEGEALARQWFGNYVFCADWSDVWLDKSFARFFNGLFHEHRNGRDEWLMYVHSFDQSASLADWNGGYRHPIVTKNYEDAFAFANDNYATARGSVVLNLLRHEIGEENWWKVVRHYVRANGGKSVTTRNFQDSVKAVTGDAMDWFFDQWVYKMGHPVFEVSKKYENGKLSVFVIQTQTPDKTDEYPQAEFFQGRIGIEIDGRIETVRLKPQTENVFTFDLSPPKFVNFDYESVWLKEVRFDKSAAELLAQLQNSRDILARGEALNELVERARSDRMTAAEKTNLKAVLRRIIAGDSYWRFRSRAMGRLAALIGSEPFDEATIETLVSVIKRDKSWPRAAAIGVLGATGDPRFAELYLGFLNDPSDRVIAAAAVALGKTKDPRAFDALARLADRPSMKNQSLLSALAGLKALGDPRGYDIALRALTDLNLPRWRLPSIPPGWDYRNSAVDLIVSLGRGETVFPLIFERFKRSMAENDLEGSFNNIILITMLGDPRGREAFAMIKAGYRDDANATAAISTFETQFREKVK
ncbi:MAG: HEAT repeat domain-containing protein [Acidobacteria bacterium]|nr:HEAT repeat domain-containing protein [Acidobacteriota bacterium]